MLELPNLPEPWEVKTKGIIKGALTAAPRLPPHWALPIYSVQAGSAAYLLREAVIEGRT